MRLSFVKLVGAIKLQKVFSRGLLLQFVHEGGFIYRDCKLFKVGTIRIN